MNTIAEKLTTIAENEQKVYDKGAYDANTRFWDGLTAFGERKNYNSCFRYTDFSGITFPNGVMFPSDASITTLFSTYYGETLPLGIDMSNAPVDNSSASKSWAYRLFNGCEHLKYVYDMKLPAGDYYSGTFYNCPELETIEILRTKAKTIFDDTFVECRALKNISFEGVIGTDINFQYSPLLTIESMKNIISHLADYSGTENEFVHTLTLSSDSWDTFNDYCIWGDGSSYDLAPDGDIWVNYPYTLGWNCV